VRCLVRARFHHHHRLSFHPRSRHRKRLNHLTSDNPRALQISHHIDIYPCVAQRSSDLTSCRHLSLRCVLKIGSLAQRHKHNHQRLHPLSIIHHLCIVHRPHPLSIVHRPPSIGHRPPSIVHCPLSTVHRASYILHRPIIFLHHHLRHPRRYAWAQARSIAAMALASMPGGAPPALGALTVHIWMGPTTEERPSSPDVRPPRRQPSLPPRPPRAPLAHAPCARGRGRRWHFLCLARATRAR